MKLEGKILKATSLGRQVILALSGGDLIYYELNESNELSEVDTSNLDEEVVSMDFAPME